MVHGASLGGGEDQYLTWGLKASLLLFLLVNPCFSGQGAVKCPGPAGVWLPEEPMMPCPAFGGDGW